MVWRQSYALLLAGISVFALTDTALAQETAATAEDGEIIVTAQKREQRLQDVPWKSRPESDGK